MWAGNRVFLFRTDARDIFLVKTIHSLDVFLNGIHWLVFAQSYQYAVHVQGVERVCRGVHFQWEII